MIQDECLACGNAVKRYTTERVRQYCDIHCQKAWQYLNITKPAIERGDVRERQTLRRYMIRERGHECELCHNTEWMGKPIPLECDHVDGDAANNLPSNLRLLCPNCHATTPTWKNRNRGSGRKARGLKTN